jgi:aminopeptidase N
MHDAAAQPFAEPGTLPHWVRPRRARITRVELDLTIDLDAQRIEGAVTHRCERIAHGGSLPLELDAHDLDIRGVEVDGAPVEIGRGDGLLSVPLSPGWTQATVTVRFAVDHPAKGMYFVPEDPARAQVAMCWTQGAMEDHSWWFPCFDSPNNLATYRIAIRHRAGLTALANGRRVATEPAGDGWTRTVFEQDRPHVLYLLNVAVGEFAEVADAQGPVPIAHYLPRGREAEGRAMFRATSFAIRWLSDYTGTPYPWARYGHVVVHRFMWGGMENTTLTTITDRVLMDEAVQAREDVDCDSLVVHELVHQWYGDLLTMKGWADIWLNESFATYLEARGTSAWIAERDAGGDRGREADELALHLWQNRQAYLAEDAGRYRRALVTNRYADAYELFDRVAYEKGSLVLHHLRCVLGEERFRAALALYTTRHAHDLVETADFRQALEDATGEPLDWFFAQWVERPGHPTLKVRWRHDPARASLIVEVEQVQAAGATPAEAPDRTWRLPVELAWAGASGVERRRIELASAKESLVLPCAQAPTWVALDPAGELPAEWDEDGDAGALLARLADPRCEPSGRARAAVALGAKHPAPRVIDGLAAAARDAAAPELLRAEALGALGATRSGAAATALMAIADAPMPPRLRRALAKSLGNFRAVTGVERLAAWLVARGDAEESQLTAGELFAARGALEHPGAPPLLRARMKRESWNQRLRAACVRGLGACGEAPAIDDALGVLGDDGEVDAVLVAACEASARLGARHLAARPRVRIALERRLEHAGLHVRAAAARALATLGDPAARGALAARMGRELFGNLQRVLREALAGLGKAAAQESALAELRKRVDEAEQGRKSLELRLEALEKRLDTT